MQATADTETQRLIGLLETALGALVQSQQMQATALAQLQVHGVQQAPVRPVVPTAPATAASLVPEPTRGPPGRTLLDWLDIQWSEIEQRSLKPQTLKNRRANLKHVRRLWGQRPIQQIRAYEITAGLREFLPERSSTARRVLAELREALGEAVCNDWLQSNPASMVKPPPHKVKRKRLTLDTWIQMCEHAQSSRQPWLLCLLLLAMMTGQRRADLAKFRFDDIVTDDRGQKFLRVEQQKQARKGYGARIELPLALRIEVLDLSLEGVIDLCRSYGRPGDTMIRKMNGTPMEVSSLSARFHECIVAVCGPEAYGEFEWPSLHETRSLSARLYDDEGHDVQTLLGHTKKEMTAIYLDDRGLTSREWKRPKLPGLLLPAPAETAVEAC